MKVAIFMGSKSDLPVVRKAADLLKEFGIDCTMRITSAHRTHSRTMELVRSMEQQGAEVFIACAGGAAHLPGVIAALTTVPVIGVPILGNAFNGMDSLLSIVQMPKGIPVATVGVDATENAAVLAAQILSLQDKELRSKLEKYRSKMENKVIEDDKNITL